jgi:hypothetical protein
MSVIVAAAGACASDAGKQAEASASTAAQPAGSGASASSARAAAGTSGRASAPAASVAPPSAAVAGHGGQTSLAASPASAGSAAAAGAPALAALSGTAGMPAAGLGATAAAGAAGAAGSVTSGCDRACLLAMMQGYIDALVAKDASRLKVSTDLKCTENGAPAKLGESVWTTAMSIVANTTLTFADPVEGQVASQFVFAESGSTQKIYQVRLKVKERTITEIESMVVKSGDQFFNPSGMKPEAVFFEMVDSTKRSKREQLLSITELYLGYLEGKKGAADVPFDINCKRYENGTVTANGLTAFQTQSWSFQVTHRILVVDEEAGITWGMFPFQQSESALVVGEAFKIIDGKIMMIQAVMTYMPSKAWN